MQTVAQRPESIHHQAVLPGLSVLLLLQTTGTQSPSATIFSSPSKTGTQVMTSPDGITWTYRTVAQANAWTSVTYGKGLFVAVCGHTASGNNRAMTSPDGITWTNRTTPSEATSLNSVTYGNGLFVAISSAGTARALASADGITWTASTAPAANTWKSVTSGNGIFVAVSSTSTSRVMTWEPL